MLSIGLYFVSRWHQQRHCRAEAAASADGAGGHQAAQTAAGSTGQRGCLAGSCPAGCCCRCSLSGGAERALLCKPSNPGGAFQRVRKRPPGAPPLLALCVREQEQVFSGAGSVASAFLQYEHAAAVLAFGMFLHSPFALCYGFENPSAQAIGSGSVPAAALPGCTVVIATVHTLVASFFGNSTRKGPLQHSYVSIRMQSYCGKKNNLSYLSITPTVHRFTQYASAASHAFF